MNLVWKAACFAAFDLLIITTVTVVPTTTEQCEDTNCTFFEQFAADNSIIRDTDWFCGK